MRKSGCLFRTAAEEEGSLVEAVVGFHGRWHLVEEERHLLHCWIPEAEGRRALVERHCPHRLKCQEVEGHSSRRRWEVEEHFRLPRRPSQGEEDRGDSALWKPSPQPGKSLL